MVKRIAFSIMLVLPAFSLIGQSANQTPKSKDSVASEKKEPAKIQVKRTRDFNSLQHKIDSLGDSLLSVKKNLNDSRLSDSRLKETLQSAESVLTKQDYMINGFNSFYTIVSILIGLFAFAFTVIPGLYWYFQIRPYVAEIRALSDGFANRFEREVKTFQEKTRIEKINQAVNNILTSKNEQSIYSIQYILLSPVELITDDHLFKIYSAISVASSVNELNLLGLLFRRKNIYAQEYITKKLKEKSIHENIEYGCLIYLAKFSALDSNLPMIGDKILNHSTPADYFIKYNNWLTLDEETIKGIPHLINYKDLVDKLTNDQRQVILNDLKNSWYKDARDEITKSYLTAKTYFPPG